MQRGTKAIENMIQPVTTNETSCIKLLKFWADLMSTDTEHDETIHHVYNILDFFFFLHNPSHTAYRVCEYLPLIWMVHDEQQSSELAVWRLTRCVKEVMIPYWIPYNLQFHCYIIKWTTDGNFAQLSFSVVVYLLRAMITTIWKECHSLDRAHGGQTGWAASLTYGLYGNSSSLVTGYNFSPCTYWQIHQGRGKESLSFLDT